MEAILYRQSQLNSDARAKSKIAGTIRMLSSKCQCGRYVYMDKKVEKTLCSWCGHYVENKRFKFRKEMEERLKNVKE